MIEASQQKLASFVNRNPMKKCFLLLFLVFGFSSPLLQAQQLDRVQGELLVKLLPNTDLKAWVKEWHSFRGEQTKLTIKERVSRPLDIWLLSFDFVAINEHHFLAAIRKSQTLDVAQFNHLIDYRETTPNDPLFTSQWQYINTGLNGGLAGADMDAEFAWDIATGGVTAGGDTIVVCVIDSGVDAMHEDLQANLWINHNEIPDNDIDDDGNGYVDDHRGWNTINAVNDDDISGDPRHGTSVSGIVGAVGNNGVGITGVNWGVKLMMVANGLNTNEARVISSYSYPLELRKQYNETGGELGAFVVATNSSWGLNFGEAETAPLWCEMYDALGEVGILSAGATANRIVDVDIDGDLPTSCPSDYLISVTNIDRRNQKVEAAGWGAISIDLGAYGEDVFTLDSGNDYGAFRGTSAATPQVAGAIALLYSSPCEDFMDIVENAPAVAALEVKRFIMEGVKPNESLDSITVTGGVLNLNNSMTGFMEECGTCPPATNPTFSVLTDTAATLEWISFDINTRIDLRWRQVGTPTWNEITEAISPYNFPTLTSCTMYEYQFKAYCESDTLAYSPSTVFTSDGCCDAPEDVQLDEILATSAQLSWGSVLAAESYELRYRLDEGGEWDTIGVADTFVNLTLLQACTKFEVQLRSICGSDTKDFGSSFYFSTRGCGACLDLNYCVTDFLESTNEWIERVMIGPLDNMSGQDPDAYGDYTGLAVTQLEQGATYPLMLVPGYAGVSFSEYFEVYIDLNQNGSFESGERVFDAGMASNLPASGSLSIAPDAMMGVTRMRVIMQFQSVSGTCPFSGQAFGEVEDYCVQIVPANNCNIPIGLDTVAVGNTMARLSWDRVSPAVDYFLRYRIKGNSDWLAAIVNDTSYVLNNLEACAEYEVAVKSRCAQEQSEYSVSFSFKTSCISNVDDPTKAKIDWMLTPNPARDKASLWIRMPELKGNLDAIILDVSGKVVQKVAIGRAIPGIQQVDIPVDQLSSGLYFVQLVNSNIPLSIKKLVVD